MAHNGPVDRCTYALNRGTIVNQTAANRSSFPTPILILSTTVNNTSEPATPIHQISSVQFFNRGLQFKLIFNHPNTQLTMEPNTEQQLSQHSPPTNAHHLPLQQPGPNACDSELKQYYFQTETKRLKAFYLDHREQLVGRKVLFNNSSGTVRYFGELKHPGRPSGSELWIGMEWDEVGRGKHNGTVNGYEYFKCGDSMGSMLKYEKIEFGYRLEIALFKRYFKTEQLHHAKDIYDNLKVIKQELKAETESKDKDNQIQEAIAKKIHKIEYDAEAYLDTVKKNKKILIQFVGFDEIWTKINNLDKIQSISLAECRICDLGALGHLRDLLKKLKILSLEDNLLSHWNQIYQLGYELPELQELSIAYNALEPPSTPFQQLKEVQVTGRQERFCGDGELFRSLRCLILIKTGLSWASFFRVVCAFGRVEEFILCKNDLSDVEEISKEKLGYLKETRFLNLEETNLSDINDLQVFSELPNLEKLILNKNEFKEFGRKLHGFQALKHLSVQHCALSKPLALYELSLLPSIESLNVKHNPIGDKFGNSYVRMRAVAELPKLTQINGALLKKGERRDFQIFYLRETFREYFAVKKVPDYDYDFEDFLKFCEEEHPNIPRLIQRYGNPYEVEKQKEIQVKIKEEVKATEIKKGTGMVEILIEYRETGSIDKRKVPLSWTLSSLRNFFSKTTKIPVGMLKLICLADQATQEEMTEDHKTLSFYSLKSGSKIIVERVPVA